MKCKFKTKKLITIFYILLSALFIANSNVYAASKHDNSGSEEKYLELIADNIEITLGIVPDSERKVYENKNMSDEMINMMMAPSIGTKLNEQLFSGADGLYLKKISDNIYQIKYRTWENCFFQINFSEPAVYKVTDIGFDHPDGIQERLDPHYIVKDKMPNSWIIRLPKPKINFDEQGEQFLLSWNGLPFSMPNDFQVKKINKQTFQLKNKYWGHFLEIDFREKKVWRVMNGTWGQTDGTRLAQQGLYPQQGRYALIRQEHLSPKTPPLPVKVSKTAKITPPPTSWPVDIVLDLPTDYPPSPWLDKQANLFQDILTGMHFNTILLPLQVDGLAIDQAGRSLITLMIHQRLMEAGISLPNPTLLARAFGTEKRTLNQEQIFQVASELGAKEIIVPMAGHNGNNEFTIRFLKFLADAKGKFNANSNVLYSEKSKIPFSDTNPPSLAVSPLLDELLKGLNIKLVPRKLTTTSKLNLPTRLPSNPLEAFKTGASPLENAFLLQLIGVLHPNSSFAKNGMFARSLLAAWELPAKNPSRKLLIARALFNLNRRPAALKILGVPKTPEEHALLAYLNGDLVLLEKSLNKITAPIPKLLAELEYQDLRIEYLDKPLDKQTIGAIVQHFPGWEALLTRKLLDKWPWTTQPNLIIKEMMDQAFPVENFTAKGLVTSKIALGLSPLEGPEVELCAYEHYYQIHKKNGGALYADANVTYVNPSDYLQLLYEISEANLISEIYKSARMRGLADEALEKIRKYDPVYKGLPVMAMLESEALNLKARSSRGEERTELEKQAQDLATLASYWSMGQVSFARNRVFDQDFPKQYYWHKSGGNNGDSIASLENSLLYTNEKFQVVKDLYKFYNNSSYKDKLNDLLNRLETRFVGNPDRQILLSDSYLIKGDAIKAKNFLDEAIKILPDSWGPHSKLMDIAIQKGNFDEAFNIAISFDPFSENEPQNSVQLSFYAYEAGMKFFLIGEADKALPLFELAQKFQTGSTPEMISNAFVNIINEDYQNALSSYFAGARRYPTAEFLSGYLKLLHLIGLHDQAWAVFNNLPPNKKSPEVYGAALYGMAIEGKTDQEMMSWIGRQDQGTGVSGFYLYKIIDSDTKELKEIFEKGIPKSRDGRLSLNPQQAFMNMYLPFRLGAYERPDKTKTFETQTLLNTKHVEQIHESALPYSAFYFNYFGRMDEFRRLLGEFRDTKGVNYFEQLTEGIVAGLDGDPKAALECFRKARLKISLNVPYYHFPPLYQLAETCEWFFEKTKDSRYRDAALDFARWHNRQDPTAAWPYTFLAKYSSNTSEKGNALARAVYLSPNSTRLSAFSPEEKGKALELFKKEGAFARPEQKSKKSAI